MIINTFAENVELPTAQVGGQVPPGHEQHGRLRPEGEDEIKMEAIMAVKPSGGQEGSFRFVLSGNKPVKLKFNKIKISYVNKNV